VQGELGLGAFNAPEVGRPVRSDSPNSVSSYLSNEGGYPWQGLVRVIHRGPTARRLCSCACSCAPPEVLVIKDTDGTLYI